MDVRTPAWRGLAGLADCLVALVVVAAVASCGPLLVPGQRDAALLTVSAW
jgi:hypothetical protein